MFEKVRKPGRGKTITAYIIFGAICLVFVFFGVVPGQLGFQQGGAAAVVNNVQVSLLEYSRQVDRLQRQYSQQLQMLPEAQRQSQTAMLKQQALEQLIDAELIYQAASEAGLVASDEEVRETIVGIPAFNEEGRFLRERYTQYLQSMGFSPGKFESQIRKDLVIDKWRQMFLVSIQPVEGEKKFNRALDETQLEVDFVRFDQSQLESSIKVSDSEVADYLANPENLKKVQEHFETIKSDYSTPEEIRARHILITAEEGKQPNDADLLEKAQAIKKELETKDFAEVAKSESKDPGSSQKGGDLGFFSKGKMVPEFEKVAFSLEKGVVSEPVKTSYGYHIIKVEEKREATSKEFEAVKNDVAAKLLSRNQVQGALQQMKGLLAEGKSSEIDSYVKERGWKWETTGKFKLSSSYIAKLGSSEDFMAKISEAKVDQLLPELVESGGQYYMLKLKSVVYPDLTVAEVKAPASEFDFMELRRAGAVFSDWLEKAKSTARISRNSQVL